jgi:hypothetical protein
MSHFDGVAKLGSYIADLVELLHKEQERRKEAEAQLTEVAKLCGNPDTSHVSSLVRVTLAKQEARLATVVEALEWLVNTCCDVGRDGNSPTMNEHIAAIESGKDALVAAREQPTQDHAYLGWTEPTMDGKGIHYPNSACKLCGKPESAHQPTQEKPEP